MARLLCLEFNMLISVLIYVFFDFYNNMTLHINTSRKQLNSPKVSCAVYDFNVDGFNYVFINICRFCRFLYFRLSFYRS